MKIIRSEHSVTIGTSTVQIAGQTGPIAARWKVDVDGREVANEKLVVGRRSIEVPLPDGTTVQIELCCAPSGHATMVVNHDGALVDQFTGTVA